VLINDKCSHPLFNKLGYLILLAVHIYYLR